MATFAWRVLLRLIHMGLLVLAALAAARGDSITPYRQAIITTCVGSFGIIANPPGPCLLQASSNGTAISNAGTVSTSGEVVNYSALSVFHAGSLGGSNCRNEYAELFRFRRDGRCTRTAC